MKMKFELQKNIFGLIELDLWTNYKMICWQKLIVRSMKKKLLCEIKLMQNKETIENLEFDGNEKIVFNKFCE